ncbi:RNA-guided endonuclease TnpB family protein [Megasphaera sp.]|uniref:RNA-guided endonuclease InsQ/TnpB family protein n=1 Tax=Megasphaera sp. TaxID=2023260 RepID=UPI002584D7EA|nr:RNA-guided endonuclease TnpB family protein [Megasphaera sp.]
MIKTYKFKLYAAKRNKKLHRQINAAGLAYNHCIAIHKRYWRLYRKSLNKFALQKHLTKLKKLERFSYLKEIGSQALQDVTDRIDRAYKLFWTNLDNKRKTAPPGFKKVRKYKSYTLKQAGWKLDEGHGTVYIAKQKYRYFKSRSVEGRIKTLTVKRDTLGDIYLYFVCEQKITEVKLRTGKSVGFDFCFKDKMLVAPDEENDIAAPSFFQKNQKAIRTACRNLSRRQLCSKNRQKYRKVLARLYRKQANQRRDFHFKLAKELCQKYAVICFESLSMKAMQQGHGKKVNDYGFAAFKNILEYVGRQTGTQIVKIDEFYPSSQICHDCGYQNKEVKNIRVSEWTCPSCGIHHDRDRNAARNILSEGLRLLMV